VALFVLVIVGVVVAQTWFDWRDAKRAWALPDWAKGMALAGVLGASLTAATAFASYWIQDGASQTNSATTLFWPELGFLLCALGIIVAAVRKKRLRLLLVLTGLLIAAFWLGMTLSS
jgi:hypothetical protein